jgi:hypothetical protein
MNFDAAGRPIATVDFDFGAVESPDPVEVGLAGLRQRAIGDVLRFLVSGAEDDLPAVARRALLLAGVAGQVSLRRLGDALGCSHTQASRLVTQARAELIAIQRTDEV